jgi:hypothetical protein
MRRGDGDDQAKFGYCITIHLLPDRYEEELNVWLDELWNKFPMPLGLEIKPANELYPMTISSMCLHT